MATTKKRPSPPSPKGSQTRTVDYLKPYARLRTVLDALDIAVLRHYWDGETAADKNRRAAELEGLIRPVIDQLRKKGIAEECPAGLNNCGGCCVPYRCPRIE
ncbi:MAG: hypothetical protein V7641_4863 [Blastocatellia bacterium]